jgi:hypothetical protein
MSPMSNTSAELIERVGKVDREAAALLADLPAPLIIHLGKVFLSPKPLAIALLAMVQKRDTRLLAMQYKIPERWVVRYRDICLRSLRRIEVDLWPKGKPGTPLSRTDTKLSNET